MTDSSNKKTTKSVVEQVDYRSGNSVPAWVREVIEAHLAIEDEDAKSSGSLGFMTRALVIATMPYKDPKADVFKRVNGDFNLRIVAGYDGGIPYGIYPRLLMSWITTEAVKRQSPVIELGDSLRMFLREVLELRSTGGGARGSATRVTEQMKRLFGSLITAQYTGANEKRGFMLKNILIADDLSLDEDEMEKITGDEPIHQTKPVLLDATQQGPQQQAPTELWTPQKVNEAGSWQSQVRLSKRFFQECVTSPVPIDLRAYKALRGSPLAMDVYTWLTYRMSYTERQTRPIRWEALMGQFGSSYSSDQAVRDFKKAFLTALKTVKIVYPQANVEVTDTGLILNPSRPHVLPSKSQPDLF